MRNALLAGLLAGSALLAPFPAAAQELTLERVFASPSLAGPSPRRPELSPDGRLVTLLRNRADDRERYDLWAVDATTGQSRMLVDSARVGSGAAVSEEEMMRRERARIAGTRGIVDYRWSPDGRSILVPLDGDLYRASLDGQVQRLTQTEATELDAEVSKTGRYISFVRDQNLYVIDGSGAERKVTQDGGGAISWGVAEFVANEEMDRDVGHWWSPDDRYIAVARVDESNVRQVTRTAIGAEGTRVFEQRYPVAGSPNAVVDLFVMRPDGSGRVEVDLGPDNDIYLARVDWTADGNALLVQRQSRDQKRLDVLRVDPATGRSELLFSETSPTWINLHSNLRALRDGSLIWSSERSGYSHLYRWQGGRWTQLTRGNWVVGEVEGVDEARGRIYFTANADTPVEQHLYWIDMNRPGRAPQRVTEAGWWHTATMDGSASRALIFRSNPTQPNQVYLAGTDGRRIAWIEENGLNASHPYAPHLASHAVSQFGTINAEDGTPLHYEMLTPPLEPGRRYPVFVEVYGGPGVQRVSRDWSPARHQYLVDQGWIVFMVDGRGATNRGKAFEDHIYQAMGGVEVRDQLAGVEWLRRQPFVDAERIAVYGWSYGGYMVARLLQAAPETYAAGVAGAPVTRWELYDTHYTERYLGNPSTDAAPYQASSVIPNAARIADPLLLIHGMADDNVVFENTTVLMGALQGAARPFELMVYPGGTHAITGEQRQIHLWRTITSFLDRATGRTTAQTAMPAAAQAGTE